ncbi:hypothetical protein MC885_006241, partial [Smutsia gigantea]
DQPGSLSKSPKVQESPPKDSEIVPTVLGPSERSHTCWPSFFWNPLWTPYLSDSLPGTDQTHPQTQCCPPGCAHVREFSQCHFTFWTKGPFSAAVNA